MEEFNTNSNSNNYSFPELCESDDFLFYPNADATFNLDTGASVLDTNLFFDSIHADCDEHGANIFDLNIPLIALPIAASVTTTSSSNSPVNADVLLSSSKQHICTATLAANESKDDHIFESVLEVSAYDCSKEEIGSNININTSLPLAPSMQQVKANRLRAIQRWLAKKRRIKTERPQNFLNLARRAATAKRERENGKFKRVKSTWIALTSWDDFQSKQTSTSPKNA